MTTVRAAVLHGPQRALEDRGDRDRPSGQPRGAGQDGVCGHVYPPTSTSAPATSAQTARGPRDDGREVDVPGGRRPRERAPGIVTEVGTNVTQVAEGDHVAVSFIPVLWDVSLVCLRPTEPVRSRDDDAGGRHDQRRHLPLPPRWRELEPHGAVSGTFSDEMVVPRELKLVRINPWDKHEGGCAHQLWHRHGFRCPLSTGRQGEAAVRPWSWSGAAASVPEQFRELLASPGAATKSSRWTRCPSSWRRARSSAPPTRRRRWPRSPFLLPELIDGSQRRRGYPHAGRVAGVWDGSPRPARARVEGRLHRRDCHRAVQPD